MEVCATQDETSVLLTKVLDGNAAAARLLAKAVHAEVATPTLTEDVRRLISETDVDLGNVGVWIDPLGMWAPVCINCLRACALVCINCLRACALVCLYVCVWCACVCMRVCACVCMCVVCACGVCVYVCVCRMQQECMWLKVLSKGFSSYAGLYSFIFRWHKRVCPWKGGGPRGGPAWTDTRWWFAVCGCAGGSI